MNQHLRAESIPNYDGPLNTYQLRDYLVTTPEPFVVLTRLLKNNVIDELLFNAVVKEMGRMGFKIDTDV